MKPSDYRTFIDCLNELKEAALEVYNDFDTTGCDGCGVVGEDAMERLEKALRELGVLVP